MSANAPFNFLTDPLLMSQWIKEFIASSPEDCCRITSGSNFRNIIQSNCRMLADMAYEDDGAEAKSALHACLALIYAQQFSVVAPDKTEADTQPVFADILGILERAMLEQEYAPINAHQVSGYPQNGTAYLKWFKSLIASHPANPHPFYHEFLCHSASKEDIRFFLAQETNLDPRFDDILAFLQVGTEGRVKMDIASNYWDEMGNGNIEQMHTHLFRKALDALDVDAAYIADHMLEEAVISGNLSAGLALNRRHRFKAIGYFGVTEYIAPSRFKNLIKGWRRNSLPEEGVAYHDLHVMIDTVHGNSWFKNVIAPLVDRAPEVGKEIAVGALIRLNSSQRYLDSMLLHLQKNSLLDLRESGDSFERQSARYRKGRMPSSLTGSNQ